MNRIKRVIESKGIAGLRPTNSFLEEAGITIHIWNKWMENKKDPELAQLPLIAKFLDCDIMELIKEPEPVKS